jgi:hypothetical protein
MSVTVTTRINRPSDVLNEAALSAANRELRPLPAAIAWARECCPGDTIWEVVGWEDLYGD